jgi:hypothetical protein
MEERVPNNRSGEEDTASDVQVDIRLSAGTGEQDDLVTGRAQRL